MNTPSRFFDVLVDLIAPVRASVGDCLVVREHDAERPLTVLTRDAEGEWQPVRRVPLDMAAIRALEARGAIVSSPPVAVSLPQPRTA